MSELDELRARVVALETENRALGERLAATDAAPPVAGKKVLLFFFGLLALAIVIAMSLWSAAKRTSRERAERRAVAAASRIDAAGRALGEGLVRCFGDKDVDGVTLKVRVKLVPTGQLALLDATSDPPDEAMVPCVRGAAQQPRVAEAPGDDVVDVEVKAVGAREADGGKSVRVTWAQRPASR